MKSNSIIIANREQETVQQILALDNMAAGITCEMKVHHGSQASKLPCMKDVVGIVATLGNVCDDNLSR